MATVVGTGIIQIVPALSPAFEGEIAAQGAKSAGVAGLLAGRSYVAGIQKGMAGLAGLLTVGGIGTALFKVGEEFDKAYDKIRVGTGATGKVFDSLKASLRNVAMQSSSSIGDIGTAIADLNTRTGQTGPGLELLTRQMLAVTARMGGDLRTNIQQTTRLFGDWGVATKDQSNVLDFLFKTSQQTGVGLADLEEKVVFFGAPLRQFGFGIKDAATLLGKWEKEGVNTTTVLAGLRMGLGNLSNEVTRNRIAKNLGIEIDPKNPQEALKQIEAAIKGAGSAAAANQIAIMVFGKRAGPDMAAAIREGRFDIDALEKSIENSHETILGTTKSVQSFSQAWGQFRNIVKVAIEPLATKLFETLSDALLKLVSAIRNNRTALEGFQGVMKVLGVAVVVVFNAIRIGATIFFTWLGYVFKALKFEVEGAITVWNAFRTAGSAVVGALTTAWQSLASAATTVWGAIRGGILTAINAISSGIGTALGAIRAAWNAAWSALSAVVTPIWTVIRTVVSAGMTVIQTAISAGMTVVRTIWNAAWSGMSTIVSAVWTVIRPIVQVGMSIIQTAISAAMTVIRAVWNAGWAVLSTVLGPIWTVIRSVVSVGMTVIQGAISVGMTVVRTLWNAAWTVISATFGAVWTAIRAVVSAGMTIIQTAISVGMTVIRTVWNAAWTVISTTFGAIWTAIKAVVSAGVTVVRTLIEAGWKVVQGIFLTVWGLIAASFKAFWIAAQAVVTTTVNAIRTVISTVWNAVSVAWRAVWSAISSFFTTTWNTLKNTASTALNWINDRVTAVWNAVRAFFTSVWNAISAFFTAIWNTLKNIANAGLNWINDRITTVWNAVRAFFTTIWNAISAFFTAIWNTLKNTANAGLNWVQDRVNTVWNAVRGIFSNVWNAISSTFTNVWNALKNTAGAGIDWISNKISAVLAALAHTWSSAFSAMRDVLGSIWDGIKTAIRVPVNLIISGLNAFFKPINKVIEWAIGKRPLPEISPVTMARGGRLPGYGGGDSVPAMLEPGEAVIPKHLVQDIAPWAREKRIPGFERGGFIGDRAPEDSPGFASWYDPIVNAAKTVGGFVSDAASTVGGMIGDAAKWVWAKGSGFFQIGAGLLAQGMADIAKKGIDAATAPLGQPGAVFNAGADKTIQAIVDWIKGKEQAPPSVGGGSWVGGLAEIVARVKSLFGVTAMTYAGHDPDAAHASDFAVGQFGTIWEYNVSNDANPYVKIAKWIASNVVDQYPGQRFYVGTMASIHNAQRDAPGQWRPIASQQRGGAQDSGTQGHHDHVHLSVPITWGGDVVKAAAAISGSAAGGGFTRAQMEAAMLSVGAPAGIAHIMAAIGMAENPRSTRITNPTGTYDSVWALQEAWTIPSGIDINRLNTDLVYAAGIAYNLYKTSGFTPWEAYTNGSYAKFMAGGGLVKAYDAGGWLPPGLSLAFNGTGRPEPVGAGTQHNTVNLTINVANGDPVTIRTVAQQVVDDALTALARRLSNGAGRN